MAIIQLSGWWENHFQNMGEFIIGVHWVLVIERQQLHWYRTMSICYDDVYNVNKTYYVLIAQLLNFGVIHEVTRSWCFAPPAICKLLSACLVTWCLQNTVCSMNNMVHVTQHLACRFHPYPSMLFWLVPVKEPWRIYVNTCHKPTRSPINNIDGLKSRHG